MDDRLTRIEDKLDIVSDQINQINVTLGKQHVSLSEHIRRTNLLEKEVRPIRTHVSMVQGAIKLLLLLATIGAIVQTLKVMP